MDNYSENIFLGNQLLNIAKQTTISSNDIIPKALMPVFSLDLIFPLIGRFGQLKIEQYIRCIQHCQSIRKLLLDKVQNSSIPYKTTAGLLAVAYLGCGESSELMNVVYAELVKRGAWNFTIVHIQSEPNQNSRHPHPFAHGFILLGCQPWLQTWSETIRQVNENQQVGELYDQYQARTVEIEERIKLDPNYRMFGELQLMLVESEMRKFEESVKSRFPAARELGVERFLQNAADYNQTFYQQLTQCPTDIVVLDPLLNFVGNMSDYMQEQSAYFNQFHYSKIKSVLTQSDIQAFASHWDRTYAEVQNLLGYAKSKGLKPYEPCMLDLPLCAYPYLEKTEINEEEHANSIEALNRQGGLRFSGLCKDYHFDAVAEVKTSEQEVTARRIQTQLQMGNFYRADQHTFFVIPKINSADVVEKIHANYERSEFR